MCNWFDIALNFLSISELFIDLYISASLKSNFDALHFSIVSKASCSFVFPSNVSGAYFAHKLSRTSLGFLYGFIPIIDATSLALSVTFSSPTSFILNSLSRKRGYIDPHLVNRSKRRAHQTLYQNSVCIPLIVYDCIIPVKHFAPF